MRLRLTWAWHHEPFGSGLSVEIFLILPRVSLDPAPLTGTSPICFRAGTRGVIMEHKRTRELRARGYKGSQKAIYRCLASLEFFVSSPSKRSSTSGSEDDQEPVQSPPRPLCVPSCLALLPQRRGVKGGGAGVSPTIKRGKSRPGNGLSIGQRVFAHGA